MSNLLYLIRCMDNSMRIIPKSLILHETDDDELQIGFQILFNDKENLKNRKLCGEIVEISGKYFHN